MDDALQHSALPAARENTAVSALTLIALVLGLTAIAACVIIPQADANHRLAYERQKLLADLDQIKQQSVVNEEFLKKIESDPQLAQRLAERQMKFIHQGESVLPFKPQNPVSSASSASSAMLAQISPFTLVRVPPPPIQAPYEPAGGLLATTLLDSHLRLYCLAGGLFLVAMGLVLGSNAPYESGSGD